MKKEKHKEFCEEGTDERKVKDEAKIRKKSGKEELEQSFAKMAEVNQTSGADVEQACQLSIHVRISCARHWISDGYQMKQKVIL